jgi:hypothetical protein
LPSLRPAGTWYALPPTCIIIRQNRTLLAGAFVSNRHASQRTRRQLSWHMPANPERPVATLRVGGRVRETATAEQQGHVDVPGPGQCTWGARRIHEKPCAHERVLACPTPRPQGWPPRRDMDVKPPPDFDAASTALSSVVLCFAAA